MTVTAAVTAAVTAPGPACQGVHPGVLHSARAAMETGVDHVVAAGDGARYCGRPVVTFAATEPATHNRNTHSTGVDLCHKLMAGTAQRGIVVLFRVGRYKIACIIYLRHFQTSTSVSIVRSCVIYNTFE